MRRQREGQAPGPSRSFSSRPANARRGARGESRPLERGSSEPRRHPRPAPPQPQPPTEQEILASLGTELITALLDVFPGGYRLDKVLERRLRANKHWSAAERETFAATLQVVVREWRLRWSRAGLPDSEFLSRINFSRAKQVLAAEPLPEYRERGWNDAIRKNVTDWIWQRGMQEAGSQWAEIVSALNTIPPMFLRANTLRGTREALVETLAGEGFMAEPVGTGGGLMVADRRDIFRSKAFAGGFFEVQDIHSQAIAPFLQVEPGMRVIDACAGNGGKSLHLAALMRNKGRLLALDTAEWKLAELRRRAARAGVDNLETRLLDKTVSDSPAAKPRQPAAGTSQIGRAWKQIAGTADRVLVDVPCSGMGVWRRHADARWKLEEPDLQRLVKLQSELLAAYSRFAKPGGKLVYATCSVLPSENGARIREFLSTHPEWKLEEEMSLLPVAGGGDGFYAARLARV